MRRTAKDFKRLSLMLERTNYGLYVPHLPVVRPNEDMPQAVLEERLPKIQEVLITNFMRKLQSRSYLMESPAVASLSDANIPQSEQLESMLA